MEGSYFLMKNPISISSTSASHVNAFPVVSVFYYIFAGVSVAGAGV
jgi:hypothetical protein